VDEDCLMVEKAQSFKSSQTAEFNMEERETHNVNELDIENDLGKKEAENIV
jgi:hypothetical protein